MISITLLYGINKHSIAYFEAQQDSDELIFVTTQSESRFGYESVSFAEAIKQHPQAKIVIFSTFANEIIPSIVKSGVPISQVCVYNHSFNREIPAQSLIHEFQYNNDDILHCVYDLTRSLVTFDFFLFLVTAEIERIKRAKAFLKMHILLPVEGTADTLNIEDPLFRNGELANIDYIKDRVSGIIEPLCRCYSKVLSVSQYAQDDFALLSKDWQQGSYFPDDFKVKRIFKPYNYADIESDFRHHYKQLQGFIHPTKAAQELVSRFLENVGRGRKAVVITLREYDFQHHRNSQNSDWTRFVDELEREQYFPVIIRDTYKVYTQFPASNAYIFNEASIDLKVRMALYQQAFVNLSVNCGPSSLFYFLDNCHSIEFRDINPETLSTTAQQMYQASLMTENQQPFYAHPKRNRVFWGVDNYANIKCAFYQYVHNLQN